MALLDKLKKKANETSVGTEVTDLYKKIISLEKKIVDKYYKGAYVQDYVDELKKIVGAPTEKIDNPNIEYSWHIQRKDGFDIDLPKKYYSIKIELFVENIVLKKFEDKLFKFNIKNKVDEKYVREPDEFRWWCPQIHNRVVWRFDTKLRHEPDLEMIESSNIKDAIKEINKLCDASKKILSENNYKFFIIASSEYQPLFADIYKLEPIYETKKTDIKNFKKEIDNFFELFTKKYLNIKI